MQPAGRRADVLGDGGGEGDDVVLGDLLDFLDAGDVEAAALPDVARGVGGDDAGARHRVGGGHFDLQPGFVLALVAPDATHLGAGVASDHRCGIYPSASLSGGICRPLTAPSTVAASAPSANRSRATRCTSSQRHALDAFERFVEAELAIEVDLLPREVRHPARRALEVQHQAALEMILGAPQLGVRERLVLQPAQLGDHDVDQLADRVVGAPGVNRHRAGVAVGAQAAEHRVGQPALLADVLEQPRAHRAAEHGVQHVARIAVLVVLLVAAGAEADVALLELLVADEHVRNDARRLRRPSGSAIVGSPSNARATRSRTCSCSMLPTAATIRFGAL